MKFCPRCNQYFDDNTGFCGNCGGPLGVMPPQPPQFSQQPPQQGMNPQQGGFNPQTETQPNYGQQAPVQQPTQPNYGQQAPVQQPTQPNYGQQAPVQQPAQPNYGQQGMGMYGQPQAAYGAAGYGVQTMQQPKTGMNSGTKKLIIIIAAVVLAAGVTLLILGLTGVLGGGGDSIVGSWETGGGYTYTFNSDGTGVGRHSYYGTCVFKWSRSGDTVSITSKGETVKWNIVSVSDTELVVSLPDYGDYQQTLRKVGGSSGSSSVSNGYDLYW